MKIRVVLATLFLFMVGLMTFGEPRRTEVKEYCGISMERYQAEQAAAVAEEKRLSSVPYRRECLSLSEKSKTMMLKLAMAEAGGEDVEGKALVMCVVLNRIKDDEFPNTIEEVICQQDQFSPIWDGRYYDMIPDDACNQALEMVTGGWDMSNGATYFRTYTGEDTWHSQNLHYLFKHGNHCFYRERA